MAGYATAVWLKLKVRLPVLLPKLLPGYLIAFSTASFASSLTTVLENNEKKLGIAPELNETGTPIGGVLNQGCFSLVYLTCGIYLAEQYGIGTNAAWWITLWIVCALLAIATPPVAGGDDFMPCNPDCAARHSGRRPCFGRGPFNAFGFYLHRGQDSDSAHGASAAGGPPWTAG